MKDQRLLFRKSQLSAIPAIHFQGTDSCAVEILESAADIYKVNGVSLEFLYDFDRLVKDFKDYQNEYRDDQGLPKLHDFENVKVLNECIYNEVPIVVFKGTDSCAVEILKSAEAIYEGNGCDKAFLSGFNSFIAMFEEYGKTNKESIKLPQLSESEKEFVSEDMDYDFTNAIRDDDFSKIIQMKEQGYQPSNELLKSLPNDFSECTMIVVQNLFGKVSECQNEIQLVQSVPSLETKYSLHSIEQSL